MDRLLAKAIFGVVLEFFWMGIIVFVVACVLLVLARGLISPAGAVFLYWLVLLTLPMTAVTYFLVPMGVGPWKWLGVSRYGWIVAIVLYIALRHYQNSEHVHVMASYTFYAIPVLALAPFYCYVAVTNISRIARFTFPDGR